MKNLVEPIRSKSEIHALEEYLRQKNKRNCLFFVFGINTGLRISDILGLNVSDVLNKNFVEIKEKKTGKYKKFPLNDKLRHMIKLYVKNKKPEEPLFVGRFNKRLNRSQVYRFLNAACNDIGISSNIGTHTMRKTFGFFFISNLRI